MTIDRQSANKCVDRQAVGTQWDTWLSADNQPIIGRLSTEKCHRKTIYYIKTHILNYLWEKVVFEKRERSSLHLKAQAVKPQPNGLASRHKFSTCVQLGFRLATHLRGLATTCVDFGSARIRRQIDASFHRLSNDTSWSREIYGVFRLAWTCQSTCESVWPPFASPYASSGFANLRWFLLICIDLRVRLANAYEHTLVNAQQIIA